MVRALIYFHEIKKLGAVKLFQNSTESVAGDDRWVHEIRDVFLKHQFDLSGSLAEGFKRFEKWAQGYYRLPDRRTLRSKLLELGLVQNPDIVDLLISELASNAIIDDITLPEMQPSDELEFDLRQLDMSETKK